MKKTKFLFDDVLIKISGKLMMFSGVLGIIVVIKYDTLVGRVGMMCKFGSMQWLGLCLCLALIYVGYIHDDFMKSIKE